MKRTWQRAFAIAIAVLMMFSTVALFFPIFSASQPVTPTPAPTANSL